MRNINWKAYGKWIVSLFGSFWIPILVALIGVIVTGLSGVLLLGSISIATLVALAIYQNMGFFECISELADILLKEGLWENTKDWWGRRPQPEEIKDDDDPPGYTYSPKKEPEEPVDKAQGGFGSGRGGGFGSG